MLLGGEAVTPALWQRLAETEGTVGYNLYGPTEYTINTLGVGTFECLDPVVGVAIDNTEVYVLDPWLRPLPDGAPASCTWRVSVSPAAIWARAPRPRTASSPARSAHPASACTGPGTW